MSQLSQLLARLPGGKDVHMSTMGHVLWVCWQGNLPQAVNQTLLNYGGMLVGEEHGQAIWFFFTDDVFLALARLRIWGNFNELPVSIELFPGRLQLSSKREASLVVDGILSSQEIHPRETLDIWIHPKSREGKNVLPGITFQDASGQQGMASAAWAAPEVDLRMPYSSTQAWFAVLHPLGSPLDKAFQAGWSNMFIKLEGLLQELKIKSIAQEGFVMLAMDNLLMLRTFMRKYLDTFDKEKLEPGSYWPCVCVVADRNNLNFNSDLPKKIGLQWDNLMPDFPYLSYRNAYLLGEGFSVRDLRYTGGQTSMDSWCNVLLDENRISNRSIPLIMAGQLAAGASGGGCFYCGMPNHTAAECPTRTYFPSRAEVWQQIESMDLEVINDAFRRIETILSKNGLKGFNELLEEDGPANILLQAIFDLNGPCQLRNVPRNWLYRMREPDPDDDKPARDESPAWELLEKLARSTPEELSSLDKEVVQIISRHQRDPRLRMVRAFIQIERGDNNQALNYFREAAAMTPWPALQAWNEYLQGRLLEEQGQLAQASAAYTQVLRVMPQWREVTYRGIICRVKMGFAEQVLDQVVELVRAEPEYFNRFLIDPALERGRLLVLSALFDLWEEARTNAENEKSAVHAMQGRLMAWFPEDHPVQARLGQKVTALDALGKVDNYMAFFRMVRQRPQLEKELEENIQREVDELRNRYKSYLDVLEEIRDEASWFPFPSALRDFSSEFNASAGIINWAFASNFNEAETFKRAQNAIPRLDELLQNLKARLKFLRTVRDSTLFGLTMLRTFMWVEIVGLLLCFIGVPVIVIWGEKMGLGWLKYLLGENQWSIQKVLVIIVTILAVGVGALRTTLVFDRKREKLLEQARTQREKAQQTRIESIRKQRLAQAKKLRRQQEAAQQLENRRQLKARMQG